MVLKSPQLAEGIIVAEFAENPGLLGSPARAEVVEQAAQVLKLGVEMVIVELGEFISCFALPLACAPSRRLEPRDGPVERQQNAQPKAGVHVHKRQSKRNEVC